MSHVIFRSDFQHRGAVEDAWVFHVRKDILKQKVDNGGPQTQLSYIFNLALLLWLELGVDQRRDFGILIRESNDSRCN